MLRTSSPIYISRLVAIFVLLITSSFISSVSSSTSKRNPTTGISTTYPQQLHGIELDPFVQNAPLVIAVACRNGVAFVAATEPTSFSASDVRQHLQKSHHKTIIDSEPLLYYNANDIKELYLDHNNTLKNNTTTTIKSDTNVDTDEDDVGYPFVDLPDTFAGPFRIQSITTNDDRTTTIMTTCGWKVDGSIQLLNAARDIVGNERHTFGDSTGTDDLDESSTTLFLANQLSLYMAQCAVSERFRALSCIALIGGIKNDSISKHGCLWFIDVTGAYPVRAHCMGGGTVSVLDKKTEEIKTVQLADYINQELLLQFRLLNNESISFPYFDMTTDDALIMILDLLSMKIGATSRNTIATTNTLIPSQSRLELVCQTSSSSSASDMYNHQRPRRRKMIRKRISDVWGMKRKKLSSRM